MNAFLFGPVFVPRCVHVVIKGQPICAQLEEGWIARDGTTFWKLTLLGPLYGTGSWPQSRLLQCSALDGRCFCAGEIAPRNGSDFDGSPEVGFSQAGVVAPPESLTHETFAISPRA